MLKNIIASYDKRTNIGDLFVTSGGLVFIPYTRWDIPGGASVAVATVLAGSPAGIAQYARSKDEKNRLLNSAYELRSEDYGASIEARLLNTTAKFWFKHRQSKPTVFFYVSDRRHRFSSYNI